MLEAETPVCALSSGTGGGEGGQGRPHGCGWEEDEKLESGGAVSHQASHAAYLCCPEGIWGVSCPGLLPLQILSCGGAGGLGLLGAAE